jgi:hypothetical protein
MPSMRPHALNPRAPTAPGSRASAAAAPSAQVSQVLAAASGQAPAAPGAASALAEVESPAVKAARAGGFHESSYELQHGLQVSESEWPDDVTIPGALGDR